MSSSYGGPNYATQGALSGAGLGAAVGGAVGSATPLGAVGGAVGTAAGAGLGALAGAIAGAEKNRKIKKEFRRLQGLTNAERRQAVARAMESAGQQAGQAQMQIARDSLSDKGARNAGMYKQAQAAVGKQAAEAGAQAAVQVDTLSQQLAEARRQELLDRLEGDYQKSGELMKQLQGSVDKGVATYQQAASNEAYRKAFSKSQQAPGGAPSQSLTEQYSQLL